jgi:hypothetical protein
MAQLNCDRCGALNFSTRSAFKNHQKSRFCKVNDPDEYTELPTHWLYPKSKGEGEAKKMKPMPSGETDAGPSSTIQESPDNDNNDDFYTPIPLDWQDEWIVEDSKEKSNFDSTLSLVHWIRHCRSSVGLSNSDIEKLFRRVIFHPAFKLEDVTVRSVRELEAYEERLITSKEGWLRHVVHYNDGDDGETMFYKDPLQALATLFSSPIAASGFSFYPNSEALAQESYSSPNTANWWSAMQVII